MDIIQQVKSFAEKKLVSNKDSAHNIDHIMRTYNLAMELAKRQKVDLKIIKIAVLLHDIGVTKEQEDHSGKTDHSIESAKMAKPFLQKLGLSKDKIDHILDCIISHRYRATIKPSTLEAKIVFDADKVEALGAIGVARAFVWIGRNNGQIYKKENLNKYIKENIYGSKNGRIKDKTKHSPQLDWELKGKHIASLLYTKKARQIAKRRSKFQENFLKELEKEVRGIK